MIDISERPIYHTALALRRVFAAGEAIRFGKLRF